MEEIVKENLTGQPLAKQEVHEALDQYVAQLGPEVIKALLIPPDSTRKHSQAGLLAADLYDRLDARGIHVDVMPALGTHVPMTKAELKGMFGSGIPLDRFLHHDWRNDTAPIGTISSELVAEWSEGAVEFPIEVSLNRRLISSEYDVILSVGQVLPHEVIGMANYNKNIFVGCGGVDMINKSHFLGAAYGMERLFGRDHSPVRKVYDYAQEHFLKGATVTYVLTANSTAISKATGYTEFLGIYIGETRDIFEKAVALSQTFNINFVEQPLTKVLVYLDADAFKTTWIGCKAVYRTRMAMADGGELLIIAPGLRGFGEDKTIDVLLRKYGYGGRTNILRWVEENEDLQQNLSAAAHLIHGSSDDRFTITIASNMLKEEIEAANFKHMPLEAVLAKYDIDNLHYGPQTVGGEEVFYIDNPATGLWVAKERWK